MKRTIMLCAVGFSAACMSVTAYAHADIGVFFGFPGPVIEAPPPVVYEEAPPVVYAPAPAVYGYPYEGGYWERPYYRQDRGGYRGWRHRHDDDDED
ncbi:conserved exported hypothetical protein [Paraburkholderia piptadeniae]|uniref:Uncharacterized protein n=1 Tax=Paraburkholderia piptadeniae TaxID=1701573 RepID=A0A1N7S2Z9_9BURK|nr:conserved exported hypothetical protein [Paraburkholderia piptadeniae]